MMVSFTILKMESYNPYKQEFIQKFELDSEQSMDHKMALADALDPLDKNYDLSSRLASVKQLATDLREEKDSHAQVISLEMGKPITEARAEIEKCAWLCNYYYENAHQFLSDQSVDIPDAQAIRRFEPLGIILGIMPWNFPYWQVFRFAVPAILAGNKVLLKHAPNCQLSAERMEHSFQTCGLPKGAYQNIRLTNSQITELIADNRIKGLSLTGSEKAGRSVAETAGKALKPQVLELGGSNAFILHESANPEKAAALAAQARLLNAGQSCIAAKRFLVPKSMETSFLNALTKIFIQYQLGDPLDESTQIGPLARLDLKETALKQINSSLEQGAELVCGGPGEGLFIKPSILKNVKPSMPVFKEEVFAPIASVYAYSTWDEAVEISNSSRYGLGVSLVGENKEFLLEQASRFEEGAVFINELVKSDPRLPFGGVKYSGYGRELGPEGIRSFTNLKTIYIK